MIVADVAPTLNAHFGDKQGLEDQHINGGGDCSLPPVSHCLNAGGMGRIDYESETLIPMTGGGFDVAHTLRGGEFDASEDDSGRGTPLVAMAIQERAVSENPAAGPDGVGIKQDGSAYTIEARRVPQAVAFDLNQITSRTNRSQPDPEVHHTLPASSTPPHLAQPWAVRRLTAEECERLQGFPDDFTRIPYRGKPADKCPDGPRYKAIGNSWAVNCAEWIGERIAEVSTWEEP